MAKRLIVCRDGTCNTPNQTVRSRHARPTPVGWRGDCGHRPGRNATALLLRGGGRRRQVGATAGAERSASASWQGVQRLRLLVDNYGPDDEMFLLGFSPRAFILRDTASFIRNAEILRGEHAPPLDQAYQLFRASKRTPSQPALRVPPRRQKTGCPTSIPTRWERCANPPRPSAASFRDAG